MAANVTVPRASPVIDGVLDDVYAGPYPIAFVLPDKDPNGAKGEVWVAWDDVALYFYLKIIDRTPNHTEDGDRDNVEIHIDWNNIKATGGGAQMMQNDEGGWTYDGDPGTDEGFPYWQVRAWAGPDIDGNNFLSGANWWDMGWGSVAWDGGGAYDDFAFFNGPIDGNYRNGYIVEVKIDAPEGVVLSEGKQIPFDIQINDNINGEGERESQIWLTNSPWNDIQWAIPQACNGLLTLGGPPQAAGAGDAGEAPAGETGGGAAEAGGAGETGDNNAAAGGGDAAPEPPPVQRPPSTNTGDAGVITLVALIAAAIAGIVIFRKKTAR